MDLSQLPRLEEYTQWIDENTANYDDVPSDLKTVAYFVQPDGSAYGIQDRLSSVASSSTDDMAALGAGRGGLVRRSLVRSASTYAATTGGMTKLAQTGDLIAPEVTAIEFSYWNGLTWLPAWSSDEYGELPLAIQVRLTMKDTASTDLDATRTFHHTITLLMARMVDETKSDELRDGESKTNAPSTTEPTHMNRKRRDRGGFFLVIVLIVIAVANDGGVFVHLSGWSCKTMPRTSQPIGFKRTSQQTPQ